MDEEKTPQENENLSQNPTEETGEDKSNGLSPLEEARKLNEETKQMLAKNQEIVQKLESIRANDLISGRTNANVPQEKKEETPEEYHERLNREIAAGLHNNIKIF